jgi:membrane protein
MADNGKPFAVGMITGALATFLLALPAARGSNASQARQRSRADEKTGSAGSSVAERNAGADATSPTEIPAKSWWSVLKRAMAGFSSDRVMANAAAVTFYVLLGLFPAVAALISIYGAFADPSHLKDQVDQLGGLIPGGGIDIIRGQIDSLTKNGHAALGWAAALGIVTSIWSANAGVKAFFDALNAVYHENEKRNFFRLTLTSLGFTLGLIVFAVIALLMVIGTPMLLNFVGLGAIAEGLIRYGRWLVLIVVVDVVLAFLYRYGPSRNKARWRWVSWGSSFAAILWICASLLFSFYVANFGSYNKTYGSLGAVVGFMTWIWISSIIVLMGAEINAELEQQTERDSTEGAEKPLGARGAFKADVKT